MKQQIAHIDKNAIYKKAIWLFIILLIFEGALRKWFLPTLSTPLLFVREPIVIWLVVVSFCRGWLRNGYVISMMVVSTLSLITTLLFGHQNLVTALYGWRVFFFYYPFMFVISKVLTTQDVLKMGRFILYISIPMTALIIMQFYSPQSAWVNRGIGGDLDGAGFQGALGYFRPPGTFSFIAGFTSFQLLVGCFLFSYLFVNKTLDHKEQIKPWLLWVVLACYLLSIPYSVSRTHFFQTIGILLFVVITAFISSKYQKRLLKIIVSGVMLILIVFAFNLQGKGMEAFFARMEAANSIDVAGVSEGIIYRYLGTAIDAINVDVPFFGLGLGIGTNAGNTAKTSDKYKYFNADQEWSVIMGENGLLFGFIIILIKVFFTLYILKRSYILLRQNKSIFPWIFSSGVLMSLPFGNAMGNNVTFYGCMVLLVGFCLVFIKNGSLNKKTHK